MKPDHDRSDINLMRIQLLRSPAFAPSQGGVRQPAIDAGRRSRESQIGSSSMLFRPALHTESKIADVVHQLLRDRSIDREFAFQDNLRDVGLTSLDMTSLVLAVEAEFSIRIPDRAITPANFVSVATIGRLVATLSDSGGVTPLAAGVAGGADLSSDSPG
jgi:acyl carrier protein